ncbi:MAG: MoaD family protein [Candidatus Caldarchaeum sp.]|nr:MoaD family protein [Candidatus Caldarchaeum sp.]MDW8359577.1 MoaD family protein [Candidatus Caldarchaeum sp.]
MKVATKYFAFLRERVGKDAEIFEMPEGSTVADFIELVKSVHGDKLQNDFTGVGLRAGFALAVNGENVDRTLWRTTKLRDGDVVVILPPIAGGGHLKLGSLTPLCPWYLPV